VFQFPVSSFHYKQQKMDNVTTQKLLREIHGEMKKQTTVLEKILVRMNAIETALTQGFGSLEQSILASSVSANGTLADVSDKLDTLVNVSSMSNSVAETQRQLLIEGVTSGQKTHSRGYFQASSSLISSGINTYLVFSGVTLSKSMTDDQSFFFLVFIFFDVFLTPHQHETNQTLLKKCK
ncbi:hypothetical protein R6Q59_010976, partial [Mikania micrantha]